MTNLGSYARWVLSQPLGSFRPPQNSARSYLQQDIHVAGVVLHRDGHFQTEMFQAVRGPEWDGKSVEHRHPNVDSIEVLLCGDVRFTMRGRPVWGEADAARLLPDGSAALCGAKIRVRPTDWHAALVGPAGGAFLSIQRWLNGVSPSSVGMDWEGPPHDFVRGG